MKKFIFVLLLLLFASECFAQITDRNDLFSTRCIEEQKTGFNWINNSWVKVNFKGSKFIVKKRRSGYNTPDEITCMISLKMKPKNELGSNAVYSCYNIKKIGHEFNYLNTVACLELWGGDKLDGEKIIMVLCDNLNFSPNGYFHMSRIHENLKEKSEQKDSMYISIGKCSTF